MATRGTVHPVTEQQLAEHLRAAEFKLQNLWLNRQKADLKQRVSALPAVGGYLLDEPVNHLLHTLRRGLCLAYELREEVRRALPIEQHALLIARFALFGMANAILVGLPQPKGAPLASWEPDGGPGGFFVLSGDLEVTLKDVLGYYLIAIAEREGDRPVVTTTDSLIAITRDFFRAVRDQTAAEQHQHDPAALARITDVTFRVEGDPAFDIQGFGITARDTGKRLTIAPVLPESVVGNSEPKRHLLRIADRLALYNLQAQRNPILALGGLPWSVFFDGPPGTGKTTLFRMFTTRLGERAEQVGMPWEVVLLQASAIKDEYYGKTAAKLAEMLGKAARPDTFTAIFLDDVDLLVPPRNGPDTTGADKDILSGLMQYLAGMTTEHRGNAITCAATNAPAALDPAFIQRFQARYEVLGPETPEDYARLIANKIGPEATRLLLRVGGTVPAPQGVAPVTSLRPTAGHGHITWQELGELCVGFRRDNPNFTGRPIEAVMQQIMLESSDFDLPPEWFTRRDLFLEQPYERQVGLLSELYRPITGEMIAERLSTYAATDRRYVQDAQEAATRRYADELRARLAAEEQVGLRPARTNGAAA